MRRTISAITRVLLGAALCISVVHPAGALAQGATTGGTLTGRVTDSRTREPIIRARVLVRGEMGVVIGAAVTTDSGTYTIRGIPAGRYVVQALRLGFDAQARMDVAIVGGETHVLDFALSALAVEAEAIVVTASRRVERVADADVSVSTVDGAVVEDRHEASLQATVKNVAGVDFFETGLGQQQANLRGFVSPFGSNLLVLVDGRLAAAPGHGMPLSPIMMTPQNDVQQVEVVAGPSSALYGANAASGVLNVITTDPKSAPGSSLSATAGQRGTVRIAARTAAMVGHFGYKLAGESYEGRDFAHYNTFAATDPQTGQVVARVTDDPDFDVSNWTLTGALFAYPSAATRVVASGGFERSSFLNQTNVARLQLKDWDTWYYGLRANVGDLRGWGSLYAQTSFTANSSGDSYYLDQAARFQLPVGVGGGKGFTPDQAIAAARFIDHSRRLDAEVQHAFNVHGRQFVTSGVQYHHTEPRTDGTWMNDGPTGSPVRIDELGAYAQYEALVTTPLRLTLVGRYDTHSNFAGRFSPKASLTYTAGVHTFRLTHNRAFNSPQPYLLYAQSFIFRRGAWDVYNRGARDGFRFVNELGGAVPSLIPSLEPLGATSTELGYRGVWGTRFYVDAAAYSSRYTNFVTSAIEISKPDSGIFAIDPSTGQVLHEVTRTFLNYGDLPVLGADVKLELTLFDAVGLNSSFSYQDPGTFRNARPDVPKPGFNVPTQKYKAGATYKNWWRMGSYAELSMRHVGAFFFQSGLPYTTGDVPAYTTVDFTAAMPIRPFASERTRAAFTVKNVLDERHLELPGGALLGRILTLTLSTDWR